MSTHGTARRFSRLRTFLVALALFVGAGAAVTLPASPALADTTLCSGASYSTCTNAGYTDHGYGANNGTSYWGMFAGHNCTNYVAYVLQTVNGQSPVTGLHYATDWDTNAAAKGFTVNSTPGLGSVAQWNGGAGGSPAEGHVAYVEAVNPDGSITVSDDAWSAGPFRWRVISPGSTKWPSNFIHFKDMGGGGGGGGGGTPPPDTDGDGVLDSAPDWCLYDKGTVPNRGCPNSIHQLSGDFDGDHRGDVLSVSRGPNNEPGLAWFRSTSDDTQTSLGNPSSFSVLLPAPAWNVDGLKWAAGDFNDDNKSDLLVVSGTPTSGPGLYILLSDGTQFGNPQLVASPNPAYWIWGLLEFFAGDIDGDGRDDVIYSSRGPSGNPGLGWFRSTSDGATATLASPNAFSVVLPPPAWNTDGLKWSVGNFNGDAYDDLLAVSGTTSSGFGLYILTSNGSQLAGPVNVASPNPAYWWWDRLTFMTGRIDADNRDDIIYISRGPNDDPGLGWFPSTSTGTTTSVGSPIAFSVVLPAPAWNVSGLKWAVIDANGDNRDDVLAVSGAAYSGIAMYLLTTNSASQPANPVNVGSPNPAYWQWARLQF